MKFCITGYGEEKKAELTILAYANGHTTHRNVIGSLNYLVAGPTAGPSKIGSAMAQDHTCIISEDEFYEIISFSELGLSELKPANDNWPSEEK